MTRRLQQARRMTREELYRATFPDVPTWRSLLRDGGAFVLGVVAIFAALVVLS